MAIHARHLEFIFEIRDGAQAPDDHAAILLAHEIFQQARKALDFDVGVMAQHLLGDFDPFLHRKERLFGLAVGHAHDDVIKQAGSATHQVFVTAGQGVERSGIGCSNHANSEF
ncbi:hypothetical protein D3C72_2168800 [compost metagenome]